MTKILTHSGIMHCDEVFAVALIKIIFGDDVQVERTRDRKIVSEAVNDKDIFVIDVGGEYNPSKRNFDHHRVRGVPTYNDGCPMASSGLIWLNFSDEVVKAFANDLNRGQMNSVAGKLDNLIVAIDAVDNGYASAPKENGIYWGSASIMSLVSSWNFFHEDEDLNFAHAVDEVKGFIERKIISAVREEKKRLDFERCIDNALFRDSEVAILNQGGHGWQDILLSKDSSWKIKFVVFQNLEGNWAIQQIPESRGSRVGRVSLPKAWAGLKWEELDKATGCQPGAVFCHPARFIGAHKTFEGAMEMAKAAIMSS